MAFTNRIRLPFKLTRPQFPEDRSIYRKANGETKIFSVVVKKTYEGETDWLPEKWHQRLAIAFGHDNITIEGDKYLGGVAKEGDYDIDWQKFLDYPTAKAKFSVQVTPFDNTNSNCQTCEEANQLNLVDDAFTDPLVEGQSYEISVADNDSICCYPARLSITSFNTSYILSASLDQSGNLSIQMTNSFVSANGLQILTYRATCPSGAYDEAGVFANLSGTEAACLAPSNFRVTTTTSSTSIINFDAAIPAPDHYFWRLFTYFDSIFTLVQQGETATTQINLAGLAPSRQYYLFTRSQCDATNNDDPASNFIQINIDTFPASDTCGEYLLSYSDPFGGPGAHANGTYLDCNGVYQNVYVPNNITRVFCAMQTSPGVPVSINPGAASLSHGTDSNCNGSPGSINLFVGAGNTVPGDACSHTISVWIDAADANIHPGVQVYSDASLTTSIAGYDYIADSGGNIYNLASGTVGSSTGLSC